MTEQKRLAEEQMMQWLTTKWITKPIHVAVELGIADLLADGPQSVDDLAKKTETHAPTLFRMLRALSSVGVFQEIKDGVFGLTPLAECLLSDKLGPIASMFLAPWHDRAWDGLSHAVRTGEPGFDHSFGRPSFEWFEEHLEARSIFDRAQAIKANQFAEGVLETYDFSPFESICDVGGGQGAFLIRLFTRYPRMTGYVADLPGAVLSAKKTISKNELGKRLKAVSHDFLQDRPPICDGYFLVNVLHDWDDGMCICILNNINTVMKPNARLWIVEYILESAPGFNVARLLDLEVLVMGGGCERSAAEYERLVNAGGMEVLNIFPVENGPVILECSKRDLAGVSAPIESPI